LNFVSGEDEILGVVFAKVLLSFDATKANAESDKKRLKKTERIYIDVTKGSIIEILSKEPENWTKIEDNGEIGLVPSNILKILETKAKVIYNYKPPSNQTWLLEVKKGELLTILKQNPSGWWNGTNSDGKTGLFPGNYVQILHYLSDGELDLEEEEDEVPLLRAASSMSAIKAREEILQEESSAQSTPRSLESSNSAPNVPKTVHIILLVLPITIKGHNAVCEI
jgi:hypothetical protein